jgi:hypothetical protein
MLFDLQDEARALALTWQPQRNAPNVSSIALHEQAAFPGNLEIEQHLNARENLAKLVFVVSRNLQRPDGPVRGNGRTIDALETVFAGAGWHVIKPHAGFGLGRAVRATARSRWPVLLCARWTASSRPSRPTTTPKTAASSSAKTPSCQRSRGFLIGAALGRTMLAGEGLQHQDGHSHRLATTAAQARPMVAVMGVEWLVL